MPQIKKSILDKLINIETSKELEEDYPFVPVEKLKLEEDAPENENNWEEWTNEYEGQLAVDVFEDNKNIVIKSTIAGAEAKDVEISVNEDMLTIRGKRQMDKKIADDDYYYKECYWGGFSRTIILPLPIQTDKVSAELKNGILTIILPKAIKKHHKIPIKQIEE